MHAQTHLHQLQVALLHQDSVLGAVCMYQAKLCLGQRGVRGALVVPVRSVARRAGVRGQDVSVRGRGKSVGGQVVPECARFRQECGRPGRTRVCEVHGPIPLGINARIGGIKSCTPQRPLHAALC
eukprot:357220-Chlamydomonas_euryale.AAC.5